MEGGWARANEKEKEEAVHAEAEAEAEKEDMSTADHTTAQRIIGF